MPTTKEERKHKHLFSKISDVLNAASLSKSRVKCTRNESNPAVVENDSNSVRSRVRCKTTSRSMFLFPAKCSAATLKVRTNLAERTRTNNRCKVVVEQDHVRRLSSDVGAGDAHRDANVGCSAVPVPWWWKTHFTGGDTGVRL